MAGAETAETGRMTYAEQLKHPKWQRKRLTLLDAAGWTCQLCSATESTLHVHHKRYVKGRRAWEYEDRELMVLCEACHDEQHRLQDLLDEMVATAGGEDCLRMVVGLVGGFLATNSSIDEGLCISAVRACPSMFIFGVAGAAASLSCEPRVAAFVQETATEIAPSMGTNRLMNAVVKELTEHPLPSMKVKESA